SQPERAVLGGPEGPCASSQRTSAPNLIESPVEATGMHPRRPTSDTTAGRRQDAGAAHDLALSFALCVVAVGIAVETRAVDRLTELATRWVGATLAEAVIALGLVLPV